MASSSPNGTALDFTKFHNIINGKLLSTGRMRHGINPATEEANPDVPISSRQHVDDAVAAARLAFIGWAATAMSERQKAAKNLADALFKNKDDFAEMLVKEVGKIVSWVLIKCCE